jgi:hypothetical protein
VAEGDDGVFRIVRGIAADRVISTVDVEARHGHKSRNRHFDGYKAHISIDPDSELIDQIVATAANASDRDAVEDLLADHRHADDAGRLGLRRWGNPPAPRRRRLHRDRQVSAATELHGRVHQAALQHRPRQPNRHLPGRPQCGYPLVGSRWQQGQLQE